MLSIQLLSQIGIFLALASLIIFFTRKLAVTGKHLADLSPFSGHFISFTLLALVTSMPEMVMGISAVTVVGDVNLCAGNIFGSNLLNLGIIAAIEIGICRGAFTSAIPRNMTRLIMYQFFMGFVPILFILFKSWNATIWHLSMASPCIVILYLFLTRQVPAEEIGEAKPEKKEKASQVLTHFILQSTAIIISAMALTKVCDNISALTGLGDSFLGALLLAGVSSLPEIVLCLSLVRMQQSPMALGNILGSNFFNITILAVADCFTRDSLYAGLSQAHLIPYFFTGIMTLALILSAGRSKFAGYLSGWVIGVSYLAGMYLLFRFA